MCSNSNSVMSDEDVKCFPARRVDWLHAAWQLRLVLFLIGLSTLGGVASAPSNPCGARNEFERMRSDEVGVTHDKSTILERLATKLKISLEHSTTYQHSINHLYGNVREQLGASEPIIKWLPTSKETTNTFKKAKCRKRHRLNLLHLLYNDLELFVRSFRAVTQFPPNTVEIDRKKHHNRKNLSTKFLQEANALLCEVTEALQEYNMAIPDDRSAIALEWDPRPNHTIALLQGSAVYDSYRKFLRVWVPILDALVKPPVKCLKKQNKNRQQRNRNRRQRQRNNNSTTSLPKRAKRTTPLPTTTISSTTTISPPTTTSQST